MNNKENNMVLRSEQPNDYEAVYNIIKEAFESAEERDGNEQNLVVALRSSDAFIPDLSIVAEVDGKVVGHILFTKLLIGDKAILALAPLSVLPSYQQKGIGTALIQEGHQRARKLGYDYSVVLGSATYYPRTGYIPADELGILPCFEVPRENFMACKLRDDAPEVSGVVRYAKEFGIDA